MTNSRGGTGPGRHMWYVLLVSIFSVVMMGAVSMWFAGAKAEEARKRAEETDKRSSQYWCDVVRTMDDAYTLNPPTTATGRDIAAKMKALRRNLGCL